MSLTSILLAEFVRNLYGVVGIEFLCGADIIFVGGAVVGNLA